MNRTAARLVIDHLLDDPHAVESMTWTAFRAGIDAVWLYRSGDDGPAAALLRYQPGATGPLHHHDGWEHVLVLQGSQSDDAATYEAGSFIVNPPGSHHRVTSQDGCLALLIWERAPRFTDDEP